MFKTSSITGVTLEASGLVALADLRTINVRTALTGTASFLDVLVLAPGIHCQQAASEINGGEYPKAGALHSPEGHAFRVENPATVSYLQRVGEPGHLVNVTVSAPLAGRRKLFSTDIAASVFYVSAVVLTIMVMVLLAIIHDWWAFGMVWVLIVARLINVVVIKRRTGVEWRSTDSKEPDVEGKHLVKRQTRKRFTGAPEPGVKGDLLVVLSQDRWIRMQGMVDDLKAVTAGQWLRDESFVESFGASFATLLVYISAALAGNASTVGSLLLACLLLISVALLGLCNSMTSRLQMFEWEVFQQEKAPKEYNRRLDMVHELCEEIGRDNWAIELGLVPKLKEG